MHEGGSQGGSWRARRVRGLNCHLLKREALWNSLLHRIAICGGHQVSHGTGTEGVVLTALLFRVEFKNGLDFFNSCVTLEDVIDRGLIFVICGETHGNGAVRGWRKGGEVVMKGEKEENRTSRRLGAHILLGHAAHWLGTAWTLSY